MRALPSALALSLAAGCAAPEAPVPGLPPGTTFVRVQVVEPLAPRTVTPSAIVSRTPLEVGALATGIAVVPETGQRLVVSTDGEVRDVATGELVWSPPAAAPSTVPFGYTDVVAPSAGELAITAVGDGYLVDLAAGTVVPHFCYEPEGWEEMPNEPVQVSFGLAIDRTASRLYALPRTIEDAGYGATTGLFVAAYDLAGGADVAWWALPDPRFDARALTVLGARTIVASGTTLHAFDGAAATLAPITDLASLDVGVIEGLAVDAAAGTLLVLDATAVTEIRLEALGLDGSGS